MRQGQQNRRGRGRGRKPQNPLSRSYESNGPDVKIRGTAAHIAEKYMSLARDALASGDMIAAESYLQHAEHYNRIIMAAQAQAATPQAGDQPHAQSQPPANGGPARSGRQGAEAGDQDAANVEQAEATPSEPSAPQAEPGRGRPRRNGAQATHEADGAEAVEAGTVDENEVAPGVAG